MESNYPSLYLDQPVKYFFPPEIPFDEMNEEQQVSFNYWKQYAAKHYIEYDFDPEKQILSNFRALDRKYDIANKEIVDLMTHVTDKRRGTKMRFFYLIIFIIGYLFLEFKEHVFSAPVHVCIALLTAVFAFSLWIRFKHYWMHPDLFVVAQVLKLNEQKQKVWQLKHFGDKYWNRGKQ
jgi:hypothetical protein